MRNLTLAISILGAVACGRSSSGPGNTGGPDAPNGSGSGSGTPTTIKDIRMNQPTNGTSVTFQKVVVTAHVSSSKYGHVWVQDAGGGEYSGIQLFCNYGGTTPNCMMTKAQIDALAIGTEVDVTGNFSSFLLSTAPAGAQPQLEIDAPMITPTGNTQTPVAVSVDAATIAHDQLAAPGADPYKGAYVKVNGSSFKATSITPMEFQATCTDKSMPPQNGTTFNGFELTAGTAMLDIGLSFYNTVTYCMPCSGVAMPYPCTNAVTLNEAWTSVSGIVEPQYNKNGSVYLQLSPTSDTDLAK